MNREKSVHRKKTGPILAAAAAVVVIAGGVFVWNGFFSGGAKTEDTPAAVSAMDSKTGNLVIDKSKITETATFFPYSDDGVRMEVLALKAPDGTIRTAFNTCQVCYSSGRGYYKLDGTTLVCQNCGNRFAPDQVEVQRGGCNPVGITSEYKTETADTITIEKSFFDQTKEIFANWKR